MKRPGREEQDMRWVLVAIVGWLGMAGAAGAQTPPAAPPAGSGAGGPVGSSASAPTTPTGNTPPGTPGTSTVPEQVARDATGQAVIGKTVTPQNAVPGDAGKKESGAK